jgi:hypothetical protein
MCGHSRRLLESQVLICQDHVPRHSTLEDSPAKWHRLQTKTSSANPSTIPQPSSSYRSPRTFSSWPQTQSTMRLLNGIPLKSVLTHKRRHLTRQPAPAMVFSAHLAVKTTTSRMISRFVHTNSTPNLSASHNTVPNTSTSSSAGPSPKPRSTSACNSSAKSTPS